MALRKTIPLGELRDGMKPEDLEASRTDYREARGGWYPPTTDQKQAEQPKKR